jgi:hypothetical protein
MAEAGNDEILDGTNFCENGRKFITRGGTGFPHPLTQTTEFKRTMPFRSKNQRKKGEGSGSM